MRYIESEKQLRALVSPARQEIIDAVQAVGACSVAELSSELGLPADGLYYHTRRLIAAGLLVEVGRKRSGKRFEVIYDLPARDMRVKYPMGNSRIMGILTGAVSAMLRLADRDFRAGIDLPDAVGDGPDRNLWAARSKAWLNRSEVREVRKHLEAITKIMHNTKRTPRSQLHTVSWIMTPVNPNTRVDKKKEQKQ